MNADEAFEKWWAGKYSGWTVVEAAKVAWLEATRQAKEDQELSEVDVRYLVGRLETVVDLLNSGEKHMAIAKLLADISALKEYNNGEGA